MISDFKNQTLWLNMLSPRHCIPLFPFVALDFSFNLLPLANEVWSKVMFLHLSVSHAVHRGVMKEEYVGRGVSGGCVCVQGMW